MSKEQAAQEIETLLTQFVASCEGIHRWAAVALQYEIRGRLTVLTTVLSDQEENKE